jgi:hypothetical protein
MGSPTLPVRGPARRPGAGLGQAGAPQRGRSRARGYNQNLPGIGRGLRLPGPSNKSSPPPARPARPTASAASELVVVKLLGLGAAPVPGAVLPVLAVVPLVPVLVAPPLALALTRAVTGAVRALPVRGRAPVVGAGAGGGAGGRGAVGGGGLGGGVGRAVGARRRVGLLAGGRGAAKGPRRVRS